MLLTDCFFYKKPFLLFFKTQVKGLTNTACCGNCRVVVFTDEALDLTVLQYHCLVEHDYVHPSIFFILLLCHSNSRVTERSSGVFLLLFFFKFLFLDRDVLPRKLDL